MLENAIKYNSRKKERTFISFLIFLIMMIALNIAIYLKTYLNKIDKKLFEASNSSFLIKGVNDKEFNLKGNSFSNIKEVYRNYYFESLGSLQNGKVYKGEGSTFIENLNPEYQNVLKLRGVSASKNLKEFIAGVYELTEGHHVNDTDKFKILVHEKLKEINNYKLGDKVKLRYIKSFSIGDKPNKIIQGEEYEFEIVGFYKGIGEEKYTGLTSDLSENGAFVNYSSLNVLAGNQSNPKVNKIFFISSSKKNLDNAYNDVKKSLNSKDIEIERGTNSFEELEGNVESISKILSVMNIIIVIGSLTALSLILNLWMRDRIHEIGIMISMGRSKFDIFMQLTLELILISIPCFILSYLLNMVLNHKILFKLLKINNILLTSDINISNFKVSVYAYLSMILIIIISVLVSLSTIIFKKPKDILKKLS